MDERIDIQIDETKNGPLTDITPREEELLKKYRKLSIRDRDILHRTINVMSKEICYGKSIGNGIGKKTV